MSCKPTPRHAPTLATGTFVSPLHRGHGQLHQAVFAMHPLLHGEKAPHEFSG